MATVLFYLLILLSSTFFVYISQKGKGKLERIVFLTIAFLIVFIPSAIRYDIGVDYLSYLRIYENFEYSTEREPGFHIINWVFYQFNAPSQYIIAFFAFIFTLAGFSAYPKKNAWILHLAFISLLWMFSFNGIRQAIAQSICMLALFRYFDKKYTLFFILTLLASAFHLSAIFITLLGAVSLIPLREFTKTRIVPVILVGFLAFTFVSANILLIYIEQILTVLGFSKYAGYFGGRHFIARDFGSGLGIIAKVLFCIYIILNTKSFIKDKSQYWLLILLIFAYATSTILAGDIVIFSRMAMTFIIAPIVATYVLYNLSNKDWRHRIVLNCFVLFLLLLFIKDGMGIETSYADPKRNPYQTIFSYEYKYR